MAEAIWHLVNVPWGEIALGVGLAVGALLVFQALRGRPRVAVPTPGQGTMEDVRRLLGEGHKIAAIKIYREVHGVGLKEAKEAVDAMAG